jgi:signal peptidase I
MEKGLDKRVIAVEGDTIEIKNKDVYLNGERLAEWYVQHTRSDEVLVGDNLPKMTVPKGHVFVMGDNRAQSYDSRDWGALDAVNIKGQVLFRIYPFKAAGYEPGRYSFIK